jgi:hypothetical protein
LSPPRAWSPIHTVAGLLVIGVLIGGAIVLRPWERAPVDASLAEHPAPVAVLPEVSARPPAPELAGLDREAEAEVSSQVDALDIDTPELQPKAILPPLEVATDQAEPDLPSIEPAAPPVIAEAEATAELPVLAAVKTERLPDVVDSGVTGGLAPAPAIAQVEVVTEPERAIHDETSSAGVETASAFDPAFDVDAADTLSESSVETVEESAAARLEETPATSSAEAEAEVVVPSIVVDRETKQRDGRRKRERKRIMGQINRYR